MGTKKGAAWLGFVARHRIIVKSAQCRAQIAPRWRERSNYCSRMIARAQAIASMLRPTWLTTRARLSRASTLIQQALAAPISHASGIVGMGRAAEADLGRASSSPLRSQSGVPQFFFSQ